jgi:hypothetical protein
MSESTEKWAASQAVEDVCGVDEPGLTPSPDALRKVRCAVTTSDLGRCSPMGS